MTTATRTMKRLQRQTWNRNVKPSARLRQRPNAAKQRREVTV